MKLPSKLHISDVEKFRQDLEGILDSPKTITIDISDVESIDTASLQVLCALQKSLALTHNKIAWEGSSKAFKDAADVLGVADFLSLKQ